MNNECPVPGYRYLKLSERVPDNACWYDEDPAGTEAPLMQIHGQPGIFQARLSDLRKWHAQRHKEWPSDAHGTCGVVVPV